MSQIEKIGTALFGKSWMTQIGEHLTNANGEPLSRQSIQNWHRRDNLPKWAIEQLASISKQRLLEVEAINNYLASEH